MQPIPNCHHWPKNQVLPTSTNRSSVTHSVTQVGNSDQLVQYRKSFFLRFQNHMNAGFLWSPRGTGPTHWHTLRRALHTPHGVLCKQTPLVVSLSPTLLNLSIFWSPSSCRFSPCLCLSHSVCHRPLTPSLSLYPSFHVGLSIPFFSAFTLQRALHFTGTTDERLGPSARADKTPSHTRACRYWHTYRCRNKETKRIQRCRCITKPVDAHTAQERSKDTLQWTHTRSANMTLYTKIHTHTPAPARKSLCRTHALKPLRHILHVKRERKEKKRKKMGRMRNEDAKKYN